jgi:hypothetical protein
VGLEKILAMPSLESVAIGRTAASPIANVTFRATHVFERGAWKGIAVHSEFRVGDPSIPTNPESFSIGIEGCDYWSGGAPSRDATGFCTLDTTLHPTLPKRKSTVVGWFKLPGKPELHITLGRVEIEAP